MNKENFIIEKTTEYNAVEFSKVIDSRLTTHDTKEGYLRLYCRQYPSAYVLQLRVMDKKGNVHIATIPISDAEILAMAEYVKKETQEKPEEHVSNLAVYYTGKGYVECHNSIDAQCVAESKCSCGKKPTYIGMKLGHSYVAIAFCPNCGEEYEF